MITKTRRGSDTEVCRSLVADADPWISADQVELVCSSCAESMRRKGIEYLFKTHGILFENVQ